MECGRDRRCKLPEFVPEREQEGVYLTDSSSLRLYARVVHAHEEIEGAEALAVFSTPENALEMLISTVDGLGSYAVVEATQDEIQRWCFKGDPNGLCILDPVSSYFKDDLPIAVGSLNEWAATVGNDRGG